MIKNTLAAVAVIFMASTTAMAGDTYVEATTGTTFKTTHGYDNSNVLNLGVGKYISEDVRIDLQASRDASGYNQKQGEIEVDKLVSGMYYDINTQTDFTPFVGLNLGYGWAEGTAVNAADKNGIVYGGTTGVSYYVAPNWSLVTQYKYLTSDSMSVSRTKSTPVDWSSHSVTAGVRYAF